MSIRMKILCGCLGLTLITISLGLHAQLAQRTLGALAIGIYDDALIAVSHLRSSQNGIMRIERELSRPSIMAEAMPKLERIVSDARADLAVAQNHAMSAAAQSAVAEIAAMMEQLAGTLSDFDSARLFMQTEEIEAAFGRVVKLYAADGYRDRRRVARMVDQTAIQTWLAIAFAIVAALGITVLLSRSIVPALRDAVRVAQAIASGKLDNVIAGSGRSETARLLCALSAMQASIAESMGRIRMLIELQRHSHADEIAGEHGKLEAALDNMSQGLCLFTADDELLVANRRFGEMFGMDPRDASIDHVLFRHTLGQALAQTEGRNSLNASCELPDGRSIAISRRPVASGGWVVTFEDVTEQRAATAKLAHMARHDVLTGLPNRLMLREHMEKALVRARRNSGLAVLCLDLDRFKIVNDTLGHGAGDLLLQAVAERLTQCTRGTDLVSRLGGDEFAIIQEPSRHAHEAASLAQRVIEALSRPFEMGGQQIVIGTSVGIALSDGTTTPPEAILKCADLALYRAKADGKGTFRFFSQEMDTELQARRALEMDLRGALSRQEFTVFYQPLIAAGEGISGFEALVRWRHPEKGMISPGIFIPLAEEIGLIGTIGGWVLQQATRDAAAMPGALKVAVNLSPVQFNDQTLVQQVKDALAAAGLAASRLELEITESVLMQEDSSALVMLHELRDMGVRIAMDDFGTGYSSLSYLRRFPFDKIKIDQSFVRGMNESGDCRAIIKAVIGLGRSLNMAINAEGVETMEQFAALQSEGCSEMQGFLFSRPRPVDAIPALLIQHGNATLPSMPASPVSVPGIAAE